MTDQAQSFSERHSYERREPQRDIAIREDAPDELRTAVVELSLKAGFSASDLSGLAERFVNSKRKPWERPVRVAGTPTEADAVMVLERWDWFWVYDFIEVIYEKLKRTAEEESMAKGDIVKCCGRGGSGGALFDQFSILEFLSF